MYQQQPPSSFFKSHKHITLAAYPLNRIRPNLPKHLRLRKQAYFCRISKAIMISLIPQYILVVNRRGINKTSLQQQITIKGMFYQFSFDTQANLDEAQYSEPHEGKRSLPTTTHNSPGSDHSYSLDLSLHSHEDSFEEGTQSIHANTIWTAAADLFRNSLFGPADERANGLAPTDCNFPTGDLEDAIKGNKLLRSRERSKMLGELQRESELCGLLAELMLLFSVPAFQEVLFLVHNIWQRHYLPYRQARNNKSFLPQLAAFVGWAGEERQVEGGRELAGDAGEVRRAAEEDLEQLARELFYSKKLRLLTLSEGKQARRDKRTLETNFLAFVQTVSRTVFLSAEGFYEEESPAGIFSEEEEMQCEAFELEGCRFVRALSQIQEDHEFLGPASKRRKMD